MWTCGALRFHEMTSKAIQINHVHNLVNENTDNSSIIFQKTRPTLLVPKEQKPPRRSLPVPVSRSLELPPVTTAVPRWEAQLGSGHVEGAVLGEETCS